MPEWLTLLLMIAVYFLPSIFAENRKAASLNGIMVVNLFLGWTLIGWVVALAWAVSGETWDEKERRLGQN